MLKFFFYKITKSVFGLSSFDSNLNDLNFSLWKRHGSVFLSTVALYFDEQSSSYYL